MAPHCHGRGLQGLHRLTAEDLPGFELLYLDEVAALAMGSGPANRLLPAADDGIEQAYGYWIAEIGDGFVPPWRVAAAH